MLDSDGEIPKVFRTGLLKSDTQSSLSRLMSEIEKNQPSEFEEEKNMQNALYDEMAKGEHGSGDTSVDSRMEETPANYNIPNQRFDQELEDYDVIPEEGEDQGDGARQRQRRGREGDKMGLSEGDYAALKRKKKKKKKKPKKKENEFLEPTNREVCMANAYGGIAKG